MKKIFTTPVSKLNALINPGGTALVYPDATQASSRGVNLLCVYITIFLLISTPVFYHITGNKCLILWSLPQIIFLPLVIALHYWRRYYFAKVVFYLTMNVMTLGFSIFLDRPEEALLMNFFLLSLIFVIFEETEIRIICLLIIIARIFLLELNFKDLILKASAQHGGNFVELRWTLVSFILSLIILTFYLYISRLLHVEKISERRNVFAQHMSHDVQVAFFSMAGIAAHLKGAMDNDLRLINEPALVNSFMDASNYFSYILKNFLEYTKSDIMSPELVHFEEMDLGGEIEKIVDLHGCVAQEKGIHINALVGDDLPVIIVTDKTKVIRIFLNLLSNAIKNTPRGSDILVTVDAAGKDWKLSVINEGEGLRQEEVNTLFIPNRAKYTNSREKKIGFGLGITKELVDTLGGHIDVFSELNKKTSFTVSIPLA